MILAVDAYFKWLVPDVPAAWYVKYLGKKHVVPQSGTRRTK